MQLKHRRLKWKELKEEEEEEEEDSFEKKEEIQDRKKWKRQFITRTYVISTISLPQALCWQAAYLIMIIML
jgi:hypothetical protein